MRWAGWWTAWRCCCRTLSRFTSTAWLVNGSDGLPALAFVAAQTAIYGALIVLAGLFDLYRKNL